MYGCIDRKTGDSVFNAASRTERVNPNPVGYAEGCAKQISNCNAKKTDNKIFNFISNYFSILANIQRVAQSISNHHKRKY